MVVGGFWSDAFGICIGNGDDVSMVVVVELVLSWLLVVVCGGDDGCVRIGHDVVMLC